MSSTRNEIHTRDHLAQLDVLASEHSSQPIEFVIADDLRGWAASFGIKDGKDPNGRALIQRSNHRRTIALRSTYTAGQIENQIVALCIQGWEREVERLEDPTSFLRFLLLHELAHLENNWRQENEQLCNEWAFQRLA